MSGTQTSAPSRRAARKALKQELANQAALDAMNRSDWARRHPQKAREERALRKLHVEMLHRWSHKQNGTPETHERASRTRQGAVARLCESGAIDADQLAAATMIACAHERIAADVNVRTASLETRVDRSKHGDAFWEALGAVRAEMTYSRWRAELGGNASAVLAIIVEDLGIAAAARRHRMHVRKLRPLLIAALDNWWSIHADMRRLISSAELAAAHAGILA